MVSTAGTAGTAVSGTAVVAVAATSLTRPVVVSIAISSRIVDAPAVPRTRSGSPTRSSVRGGTTVKALTTAAAVGAIRVSRVTRRTSPNRYVAASIGHSAIIARRVASGAAAVTGVRDVAPHTATDELAATSTTATTSLDVAASTAATAPTPVLRRRGSDGTSPSSSHAPLGLLYNQQSIETQTHFPQ